MDVVLKTDEGCLFDFIIGYLSALVGKGEAVVLSVDKVNALQLFTLRVELLVFKRLAGLEAVTNPREECLRL